MLSSCVSDGKPLAQMTFEHIQAKPVYIASYEVINDSGAVRQQGFIGDPAQSITDYFSNRFVASGSNGKLIARVSDVKIGHRVTESSNSFGAFLGVDKHDEYMVNAVITLQLYGYGDHSYQEIKVRAKRVVSISEHKSLVEREQIQMETIDHLIDDIDIEIHRIMRDEFQILQPY